ncbi:MAG: DUF808 domain-containing protein [Pseudomonadota bacterium]
MSTGLIALLDDIAALTKVAAASLDDVTGQALKAGSKSAGVVIDDAAVTPRYVVGFAAERELPIVWRIAVGSIRNKLLILLPIAMALSAFLPAAITPLLMLGGLFLCYEGAEKVYEIFAPHHAHAHEDDVDGIPQTAQELEDQRVSGAIRTDFILSAEIMAIALNTVTESHLGVQAAVLAIVAVFITVGVYGAVAVIVKADDVGVAMARLKRDGGLAALWRATGRGIVSAMPFILKALSVIGTAAMIWVGGGILLHGLEGLGISAPAHWVHAVGVQIGGASAFAPGFMTWLVEAALAGVFGLIVGGLTIPVVGRVIAPLWRIVAANSKAV